MDETLPYGNTVPVIDSFSAQPRAVMDETASVPNGNVVAVKLSVLNPEP